MPRYSNMQIFSDKDTKLVSGYAGGGPSATDDGKKGGRPKARLETEKVVVTTGSAAGAGSGEFDLYRAARNRERDRIEQLEVNLRKEAEEEVFAAKVERNKREAEERTEKNRLKRLKKKAKASQKKGNNSKKHGDESSSDSEAETEENERPSKKAHIDPKASVST
jgi:hypothetical protein